MGKQQQYNKMTNDNTNACTQQKYPLNESIISQLFALPNKLIKSFSFLIIFIYLIVAVTSQNIVIEDIQTSKNLREDIKQTQDKIKIKKLSLKQQGVVENGRKGKSKKQQEEQEIKDEDEDEDKDIKFRDKFLDDRDLQLMIPDSGSRTAKMNDSYTFSMSIHHIVDKVKDNRLKLGYKETRISKKQYLRAIVRTQLVHNVNFKGEIEPQLTQFDSSLEAKRRAIQKIIDDQQRYYQSVYKISKYMQNPKRFCIVVPSYQNVDSKLYLRNLDSIFMQDYTNYHVVYIDDASPDKTGQYVQKYIMDKKIPNDKIRVIINPTRMRAIQTIYNAIHSYCKDGEIVGLIDGDDSLNGRKVLQLYNSIYKSKQVAFVYSNFLRIKLNYAPNVAFGWVLSQSDFKAGILRKNTYLLASHFLTFYADVFKKIQKQDLTFSNGTFFYASYDKAIMTPIIQMVYPRIHYIPQLTYEYRNDTKMNIKSHDWWTCAREIDSRPAYKTLQDFEFMK